ncbi:hypothetical protein BGZ73_000310 [Actinomortierella ambigua]|nr:hypothetical protein BGZ73_000310 [Actinomortierella ambigua]
MGVKGFTNLLREFAPDAITQRTIGQYRGKTLAIDVSCFLNRFIYGPDPHPARVQQGLYRLVIQLQQYNIRPVFVFDGKNRIAEKRRENEKRALAKLKIQRSFQLERDRKSRLREIKDSAQLFRHYSPDQVSTILESVRLDDALQDWAEGEGIINGSGSGSGGKRDDRGEAEVLTKRVREPLAGTEPAAARPKQPEEDIEMMTKDYIHMADKKDGNEKLQEEMETQTTRRQKELHRMELDLVHQIKTLSGSTSTEKQRTEEEGSELAQPLDVSLSSEEQKLPLSPLKDDFEGSRRDDSASFSIAEDGSTEPIWQEQQPSSHVQDDVDEDMATEEDRLSPDSDSVVHVSSHLDVVPTSELHTKPEDALGSAPTADPSERPIGGAEVGQTIRQVLSTHESVYWSLERRSIRITWNLVVSCQKLVDAMGQAWVIADDAEAEAVCAQLTTRGLADGTVSEDSDTAVFGDGVWIRHFGSKVKSIAEVNPVVARERLGVTRDAFRDLCILCGTDFSETIEGIGPKRAVKLIKRYGSIESIMANSGYKPREFFLYDHARRVFDRKPTIPEDMTVYQRRPPNEDKLRPLLIKYDINPEQVVKDVLEEIQAEKTMENLVEKDATSVADKDPVAFPSQPYDVKGTLGLKAWPEQHPLTGASSP